MAKASLGGPRVTEGLIIPGSSWESCRLNQIAGPGHYSRRVRFFGGILLTFCSVCNGDLTFKCHVDDAIFHIAPSILKGFLAYRFSNRRKQGQNPPLIWKSGPGTAL